MTAIDSAIHCLGAPIMTNLIIASTIAYHVTLQDNVATIQREGLIPRIGRLSAQLGEAIPRIYLFSSLQEAETGLSSWMGEAWEDIEEEDGAPVSLAILAVDVSGLDNDNAEGFFEVAIRTPIEPARILDSFPEEALASRLQAA